MVMATASTQPTPSAHLAGRHVTLKDLLGFVRIPVGPTPGGCTTCDSYTVTMDVVTWSGDTCYLDIGTFHSEENVYFVLRQFRYFLPDSPLRIAFSV